MHANVENILELFYLDSRLFDKEDRLFVYWPDYKQPSKADYRECFCRLRGNLLFIAQIGAIETLDDLDIHLLVLRNFEIKLCEESKHYEFCINITLKTAKRVDKYYFICNTRNERDKWIESIYLVSFRFLSSCRKALNDELMKKDSIFKNETTKQITNEVNVGSNTDCYISIKCENLFLSSYNPNIFVKVFCRNIYIDKHWKYLGCTEIVQSKNPHFIRAIRLCQRQLSTLVEIKFELYNVVELQNEISFLITVAYFRVNKTFFNERPFKDLKANLKCLCNNQFVGTLQFKVLNVKSENIQNTRCNSLEDLSIPKLLSSRRISSPSAMSCSIKDELMQFENFDLFCKPEFRQFSFKIFETHSNLLIEETMSESKFVFLIPQILMKLYAKDEEKIKFLIEQFYQDNPSLPKNYYDKLFSFHLKLLNLTKESLNDIINFMSTHSFRPSKNKKESFLQFIPVNFHKQSCRVFNQNRCETLDVFTVGAYSCHYLGFDKCGIKTMLNSKSLDRNVFDTWTILNKLIKVLRCESKISALLKETLLNNVANFEAMESTYKLVCTLSDNLIDLISVDEVEKLTSHLSDLCNGQINMFDDDFEPVELVYLNIKACLVTMNYKLKHKQLAPNEIGSCNRKLNSALESLRKILLSCYIGVFSQVNSDQVDILFRLRFRHLSLFTQALTTLVVFIMDRIHTGQKSFLEQIILTRSILVSHETLLSCYSDELGMLDDMAYAIEEVTKCVTVFFKFKENAPQTLMPDIDTLGDKISLVFHLQSHSELTETSIECQIVSLLFNLGINEQATLADRFGYRTYQNNLNQINYDKLKSYLTCHYNNNYQLTVKMDQLKLELAKPISKNIEILNLTEQIVSTINGIRVTCCKSAKDRTGMAITLEETRFCFKVLNLNQDTNVELFRTILDTLRRDGTRIENAFKNIGARKYAFNYLQLLTFPSKMKPPSNTYSTLNVET